MAIVTDTVAVQRFAMGLFGVQVGSVTMQQVDKQIDRTSLAATLNSYYASSFGSQTTAQVAATLVKNLGITGAGVDGAVAYVTGALNAAAPAARGEAISSVINLFSGLTNDAVYGAAAKTWNANVDVAAAYTGAANVAFGSVIHHSLTGGMDNLFGGALADVFTADLSSGGNTLQGGDSINGGAGNDTLHAFLGSNSEGFAITAKTTSVETVIVQAQSRAGDSGDNNITAYAGRVNVDAGRMSGVNNWENNNSRADLIVEDVRIADNQITKDITITMRETDPGRVDFSVYFDQNSLRNASASTSQINLQVMDTRAGGTDSPLKGSPYGGFRFTATDAQGVASVVTLQSDAINAAQNYADLAKAFQAAADKQFGAGVVTVTVGNNFTVSDTLGTRVTGQEVVIKTSSSYSFSTPAGSGWLANDIVDANSGLHTFFSQGNQVSKDLVTSTIILDDVGRGSTGGDLVVGGLSTGLTSSSKGVQRFDITVQDNSKLETISSTNNTLREVSIVNGTTSRVNNAYNDNVKDAGNLSVKGESSVNGAVLEGTYGFTDVKLIDAATFKGKLDLSANLTAGVTAKYMTLNDASPDAAAADNVAFTYNLGTNDDTFKLDIDAANVYNAGTTTREDFVLSINGGAGKDVITANIINAASENGSEAWYNNSKLNANLSINGGAGDDTIKAMGAGDWKITAGDGNDTVYSDNSGSKGVWVFNGDSSSIDFADIKSGKNDTYNLFKSTVTVNFRGIQKTVTVDSTGYKTTDLQINQAIKLAINSDGVLSKLLKASDGPANTLVVESLIDAPVDATSLVLSFAKPLSTDVTDSELSQAIAVFGATGDKQSDLVTKMALPTTASYESAKGGGSNSQQAADSTHNLGAGDDVLVLSSNHANEVETKNMTSSNETVVYDAINFGNDTIVNFNAGSGAPFLTDFIPGTPAVVNPTTGAVVTPEVLPTPAARIAFAADAAGTSAAADFGAGEDKLNFTALGGKTLATAAATSNAALGTTVAASATLNAVLNTINVIKADAANDTAVEVAAFFNGTVSTAATSHIVVVVSTDNIGTVYQVTDAAAATAASAAKIGTIDLADTDWAWLSQDNFA